MPQSLYREYCRIKHSQLLLYMLICLERLLLA
nr:MAG TPA: hypothetical protein [Bacteriophage sp.]